MSELEKKYSDYQENECKDEQKIEIMDERLCPTCEPNPNFKLEDDWWNIKKAYLNEKFCEYHVRIYEGHVEIELSNRSEDATFDDVVKDLATIKILNAFDKPINESTKAMASAQAYVIDQVTTQNAKLKDAILVAIPAFTFDQIRSKDDENAEQDDKEPSSGGEFIIEGYGLYKKLLQLRLTISTYGQFYGLAQAVPGASLVIRQERNPIYRINYNNTATRIRNFKFDLSDVLQAKGYPRLGHISWFHSKRPDRIKFTFRDNGRPFELDEIYVLPDNGCTEKYEKLNVPEDHPLRHHSHKVVYNFLQNLDKVYADITAKETKPWLDWTLEHFYPVYIADGDVDDLQDANEGLACLLEDAFGTPGDLVDTVAKEIMSAFDSLEREYQDKACRELQRLEDDPGSDRALAAKTFSEERKDKMYARYKKEFENKFYKFAIDRVKIDRKDILAAGLQPQQPFPTKENIWLIFKKHYSPTPAFAIPSYKFIVREKGNPNDGKRVDYNNPKNPIKKSYESQNQMENAAAEWAGDKFYNLEDSNDFFGIDQLQNSPHYHEMNEAIREVYDNEMTMTKALIDTMKGKNDYSLQELIPVIGLCGISKIGSAALDCLANGLTFDQFLDILIAKFFEYIQINYLQMLIEDLPADVQDDLNESFAKEFGSSVNLSDIFGVNMASGGGMKAGDIITMGKHTTRIVDLFKKHQDPFATGTEEEVLYLTEQLGIEESTKSYLDIQAAFQKYYDYKSKMFYETDVNVTYNNEERPNDLPMTTEKWVKKRTKFIHRGYRKRTKSFRDAVERLRSAVGDGYDNFVDSTAGTLLGAGALDFAAEQQKLTSKILKLQNDKKERESRFLMMITSEVLEVTPAMETRHNNKIDELDRQIEELEAQTVTFSEGVRMQGEEYLDALVITPGEISEAYVDYKAERLNKYELAEKNFQETALGVKVDIVFDIAFDYIIEWIMEQSPIDALFEQIKQYPAASFAVDKAMDFLFPSCPTVPVTQPPPNDFLKSLKVDVCDPQLGLVLPEMRIPSIDWRFHIQKQFGELFREAIIKIVTKIITQLMLRFMRAIESALCNLIETAGQLAADAITGNQSGAGFADALYDALNEAFCNDGDDPATSRSKAEALVDELFDLSNLDPSANYEGAGKKVAGLIGSVASAEDILGAIVAREGEESDRFNNGISNIIDVLAPEMRVLLGSPDQVAYFFANLGSFLSPEDRDRIRNLLDAGIPNMPISESICLTNEELENWNNLRNQLLQNQGLTPEQAAQRVGDLNRRTREAVEEMVDDIYALDSGDLLGDALLQELSKDVCNAENILNMSSASPLAKVEQNQTTQAFFKNLENSIQRGFTGKNGILGEACRDFENNTEFINTFYNFFNKNYQRAQIERDNYRGDTNYVNGIVMDILAPDGLAVGVYPKTVGITQREEILADSGRLYDFGPNGSEITYKFYDEYQLGFFDFSFTQEVVSENKGSFGYRFKLKEKIDEEQKRTEMVFSVPGSIGTTKLEYMEEFGFQYSVGTEDDVRLSAFNTFVQKIIPLEQRDFSDLYERAFESFNKSVVEMLLTDPKQDDEIPIGYKLGYVPDPMTADDFVYYNPDGTTPYNLEESEKVLGVFGSSRLVPLTPAIYGGRYSNPMYFVEPRVFSGWIELATKAFVSPSGCDPKTPPLLSFDDIKKRTENLQSSLREDSRLGDDPECISDKPFHLLMDKNTKSYMDGVVRSTLRTYIAEYYFKGYGLFSNLELKRDNYDQAMFSYVAQKMKQEMYELGTTFASSFKTIVREKYWYTFLEQCVEAYQRMVDLGEVTPSENVQNALNSIQRGLDKYDSCTKDTKKSMHFRMEANNNEIRIPNLKNTTPLQEVSRGDVTMTLQAIAFTLTKDPDEKANFFNGGKFTGFTKTDLFFSSVKKLKFFQKIYFIALYEKEATIVMSELIRDEFNRLSKNVIDGLYDRPRHRDLMKSIFTMMPGSTSRVGLNEFYMDKNTRGSADPGAVPEVVANNAAGPIDPPDEPQLIVESYGRLVDKKDPNLPPEIRNRPQKYVGAISLSNMSEFFSQNSNIFSDNHLSDFFGSLAFTYRGSIKELFNKGFTDDYWMKRIVYLNKGNIPSIAIRNARANHLASRDYTDIDVIYDEAFLLPGEKPEPEGTTGSTGVRYGLRLSLVFPKDYFNPAELAALNSDSNLVALSRREKSYLFEDGSFVLPLVSEEIDVMDETFRNTNPFSGRERYDLECLVNKISRRTDYSFFMENIFNLKQASSMLSVYCMETMMPSIGRKTAPDAETSAQPGAEQEYERGFGVPDPNNEWDGTINERGKNSLRKRFKSLYLARTPDGLNTADDDGFSLSFSGLFALGNPFDFAFQLPKVSIPWWRRRRVRTRIYDANGQECADPKKDLQ